MKFEALWDKFEQTGNIKDYLEYCKWNESYDITSFISTENVMSESGDVSGFAANGDGLSA